MNTIRLLLIRAYSLFILPAAIIHELSHVIMCVLTLNFPTKISYYITDKQKFYFCMFVQYYKARNVYLAALTSFSPIFVWFFLIILLFWYTFPIYIIGYFLLCYKIMIPSKCDFDNIKYFDDIEMENERYVKRMTAEYEREQNNLK